ncbi:MAG: YeeE/YedE thiosulfate transporter family protein [Kofleriaceae bacterium]
MKSWSPYAVGAGIGALSWFTFLSANRPLGITRPFEATAAGLGQRFAPRASGVNAYLAKSDDVPKLDWEWMVAAGVAIGSWLSSHSSGDRSSQRVPEAWARRFGDSELRRDLGAFLGGALMMFGARVAKGCTSGHAISGTQQLAASSWLFSPIMAVTAGAVARALFGKRASHAR